MKDWFEWNGKKCTEYGIRVLEQPPITLPAERATFVNVPGRSGSLTVLEGNAVYDDMVLAPVCYLERGRDIQKLAGWLKGSGKITFANRPGGFYYARIVNQIPFETILRGNPEKTFTVNFRCKPFWYQNGVASITVSSSGSSITNPGTAPSEPIITVYGSGAITLMISQTITRLEGISESITLDSTLQEAYKGVTSMNNHVSGDFPILLPGLCGVTWSGSVTKIVIQPNWRFL